MRTSDMTSDMTWDPLEIGCTIDYPPTKVMPSEESEEEAVSNRPLVTQSTQWSLLSLTSGE